MKLKEAFSKPTYRYRTQGFTNALRGLTESEMEVLMDAISNWYDTIREAGVPDWISDGEDEQEEYHNSAQSLRKRIKPFYG
jgi:hypothetical protein